MARSDGASTLQYVEVTVLLMAYCIILIALPALLCILAVEKRSLIGLKYFCDMNIEMYVFAHLCA